MINSLKRKISNDLRYIIHTPPIDLLFRAVSLSYDSSRFFPQFTNQRRYHSHSFISKASNFFRLQITNHSVIIRNQSRDLHQFQLRINDSDLQTLCFHTPWLSRRFVFQTLVFKKVQKIHKRHSIKMYFINSTITAYEISHHLCTN